MSSELVLLEDAFDCGNGVELHYTLLVAVHNTLLVIILLCLILSNLSKVHLQDRRAVVVQFLLLGTVVDHDVLNLSVYVLGLDAD